MRVQGSKMVTQEDIGSFVDSIAGKVRTPSAVAGRLLEEVVELCLAAGMKSGDIYGHVTDALHNQCLKESERTGKTIFPSQLVAKFASAEDQFKEMAEESADVGLVHKDFCHVAHINQEHEENTKHAKFIQKTFRIAENGTLYAVKSHIK